MPKRIDLDDELMAVDAQLRADPSRKYQVMIQVPAPLYKTLVLDTKSHDKNKAISKHASDVVDSYYSGCVQIEKGMSDGQKDVLNALTQHWDCEPGDVLSKLCNILQQPEALQSLLEADRKSRQQKQSLLAKFKSN